MTTFTGTWDDRAVVVTWTNGRLAGDQRTLDELVLWGAEPAWAAGGWYWERPLEDPFGVATLLARIWDQVESDLPESGLPEGTVF